MEMLTGLVEFAKMKEKESVRRTFHYCKESSKVVEGWNCGCRKLNGEKGWLNYYDENLGSEITSPLQRSRLMKKQKVSDLRDSPSKNHLVLEAADKWKWRRKHGLA